MANEFKIIRENADGYFIANVRDGWVRIGLLDYACFDFPPGHAEFDRVIALELNDIEDVYDEFFGKYICGANA